MKASVALLSLILLAASLAATTVAAEPQSVAEDLSQNLHSQPGRPEGSGPEKNSGTGSKTPAPPLWELLRQAVVSTILKDQPPSENLAKPDPTKPGRLLRPLLGQSKPGQAAPLPAITVRARVLNSHLPPAALLDIGGSLHLVRQGDDLTLPQTTYTLRVVELDRRAVRLEIEPTKQVLTLD